MINAFPFVSSGGDRKVKYNSFRRLFSSYFTTGVFMTEGAENIAVVEKNGLNIMVKKGAFNINGVFGYLDADETIAIGSSTRETYTRIILRLDDSANARNVTVIARTGDTMPQLQRTADIYELCLAEIKLGAGQSSISNSDITDRRMDSKLCGIVTSTIKGIDTTELYNQIQSDLLNFKNAQEKDFDAWFQTIKGKLSGDVAGKLTYEIEMIPRIYKGTSSTPPSQWKDGDIYVQYE